MQTDRPDLPASLLRRDAILTHPVFNTHHTEHQMLRYLKKLQNRDLALDHSMISLGSCTMKLNASSEMIPITWPEFADIHPFAPLDQAQGYLQMIGELESWLKAITGFDAICMQPNSGAQGEYAGLVAIARYHASRGESSAQGVPDPEIGARHQSRHGADVRHAGGGGRLRRCRQHRPRRPRGQGGAARGQPRLPDDHLPVDAWRLRGAVKDICAIVHEHGGQVYMDGANLNAQVGLTSPALIGADVSHMNLHKTFCIPHGGGGPGMGPIGLKAHLAPFMANHRVQPISGPHAGQGAVAAAPWGSASILPISWMYIAMMGGSGLTRATEVAILNANYIASRLQPHYPVLYTGRNGRVAHECILDIRPLKAAPESRRSTSPSA
jgi:glycine dehydrogenase